MKLIATFLLSLVCILGICLSAEYADHQRTKSQWATENAQNSKGLARLSEKYRTTERNLKEKADAAFESYLLAAEQGQLARDDVVRVRERVRGLSAQINDGAARLPGASTSSGNPGADCNAQLATCARLLAEGSVLAASGADLAAEGGDLVGKLDAKVNLCRSAWPEIQRAEAP